MSSIVLANGWLYDGLGGDGGLADVLIHNGRISEIRPRGPGAKNSGGHSETLAEMAAAAHEPVEVIDCIGLAVAPGFIDLHTHSDTSGLIYPLADSCIAAGVTTEVCGNCGGSAFPQNDYLQQRNRRTLAEHQLDLHWHNGPTFFEIAARIGSSVNRAYLVGHGNLRAMVVGYEARKATAAELDRMAGLLEESMQEGGYGLSSGLIYPPGCFSDTDELAYLARVAGRKGGLYASHIRSESYRLLEAVDEFIDILQRGGCRGVLSHVKTMGRKNWHKIDALIERMESARGRGTALYADRYPYLASWTGLDSMLLPDWAFEGGKQAELDRLADAALRPRLLEAIRADHPESDYFEQVMVVSCHNPELRPHVGRSLAEIGSQWRMGPAEAGIRFVLEDEGRSTAVHFGMNEENLDRLYQLPYVCAASDSSVRDFGRESSMTHPRAFGTSSRFLSTYARDKGLLSWGEAIRRLTSLPAEIMGWQQRGRLAPGAWADVVVFNPKTIADRSTYAAPAAAPDGIHHVLVNGSVVMRDGSHTGVRPGQLLRHGEMQ